MGHFVLCRFWRWGRPASLCADCRGPAVSDLLRAESCLCVSGRVGTRAVLRRSAVGRLLEALERLMQSRCGCWQLTAAIFSCSGKQGNQSRVGMQEEASESVANGKQFSRKWARTRFQKSILWGRREGLPEARGDEFDVSSALWL